jgi:hypothetical protein
VKAVVHAKREARRLGMDVNMSPVPGWAFGGPWVPTAGAADKGMSEVDIYFKFGDNVVY